MRSSQQLLVETEALGTPGRADTWFIVGNLTPLATEPSPTLLDFVRQAGAQARRTAGICTGGFALAAEYAGFIVAAAGLVIFGSMADREWRLREVLISSVVLTLFGVLVFIYGLDVQMRVGPF